MPKLATIALPEKTWTRVTDLAVGEVRVQNRGPYLIEVLVTADTTPPTSAAGALQLRAGGVILPDTPIATLFPGGPNPAHVWAWASANTEVSVSHA